MKKSSHLTPGEFELLEILWPLGEASVKDVWQRVEPSRGLAYTTVMTVLEKMFRKGILTQRKKGKAYLYTAALEKDQALNGVLEHVCQAYFQGSRRELAGFVTRQYRDEEIQSSANATPEPETQVTPASGESKA